MLNRRKTSGNAKLRRGVSELITPPPNLLNERPSTFSPLRSPVSPASSTKGSHSSNIKVIARFRPLNEYEKVTYRQQLTLNEGCKVISNTSVSIDHGKETETYTFDRVFEPSTSQYEVFQVIGQPVINDVLTGYNGTVFAYGQTGSGKTFSMMGPDVYDDEMRGIIPRAASQIFSTVCQQDSEAEFTLTCSMLEIYKETLRDLLNPEHIELKIKECPRRGIYVQGLTEVCVVAEDELLEVISLGEQMRTVAATKLNQASSRSHQLFMLDVKQKLPNDTEKKGRLNLVDLAGSEKVNHSGVTGNKLEETKKINLSLSALGNVIHALISSSEHVPYRDSKLTRLLQESLGGNYKTTLIVACSPSPKNIEETLNTLRFAQRAKSIRNKVTVNIKNSPENYAKLIDQLKKDLDEAKVEIQMLRERERETSCTEKSLSIQSSPRDSLKQTPKPGKPFRRNKTKSTSNKTPNLVLQMNEGYVGTSDDSGRGKKMNVSLFEPDSLGSSFYISSERAAVNESQTSRESRYIDYEKFITLKNRFDNELIDKTNRITTLENEKYDLQIKLNGLEQKLNETRKKQLSSEQKSHEYYECYHKTLHLINKDSSENAILKLQNDKLTRQIQRLTSSLQTLEDKFSCFLKDYGDMKNSTHLEFEERSESFICRVPVITEEESLDVDESDIQILDTKIGIPIDTETLSWINTYSATVRKHLEPNSTLNREITIFHLRNQIIQAGFINCDLTRVVQSLEWKNGLLKHKYEVKRSVCRHQKNQIREMENMIDYLHDSYNHLIKLMDKIEHDTNSSRLFATDCSGTPVLYKTRFLKSFNNLKLKGKKYTPSRTLLQKPKVAFYQDKSWNVDNLSSLVQNTGSSIAESESVGCWPISKKLKIIETNLNLQKSYNQQLKLTLEETRAESNRFKNMLSKQEDEFNIQINADRHKWNILLKDFKENCESELIRKHSEVVRLNELLADWIHKYMELQEVVGIPSTHTNTSSSTPISEKQHRRKLSNVYISELMKLCDETSNTRRSIDSYEGVGNLELINSKISE